MQWAEGGSAPYSSAFVGVRCAELPDGTFGRHEIPVVTNVQIREEGTKTSACLAFPTSPFAIGVDDPRGVSCSPGQVWAASGLERCSHHYSGKPGRAKTEKELG